MPQEYVTASTAADAVGVVATASTEVVVGSKGKTMFVLFGQYMCVYLST